MSPLSLQTTRDHVVTSKHRETVSTTDSVRSPTQHTRARPEFQFREGHPAPRRRVKSNRRLKPPTLP